MEEKNRKPELEQFIAIWLTSEAYGFLREQKKKQGKTMAKIIDNLIKEKYGKPEIEAPKNDIRGST